MATDATTGVRALLRAQAEVLDAPSRFAVAQAAAVAVDAGRLRKLMGEQVGWGSMTRFGHVADYSHPGQGIPEKLARHLPDPISAGGVRARRPAHDGPKNVVENTNEFHRQK